MQEKVIVAVDAMGGDNAPAEIVKGVVDAVSQSEMCIRDRKFDFPYMRMLC